jgi:hypothetical protein
MSHLYMFFFFFKLLHYHFFSAKKQSWKVINISFDTFVVIESKHTTKTRSWCNHATLTHAYVVKLVLHILFYVKISFGTMNRVQGMRCLILFTIVSWTAICSSPLVRRAGLFRRFQVQRTPLSYWTSWSLYILLIILAQETSNECSGDIMDTYAEYSGRLSPEPPCYGRNYWTHLWHTIV